MKAVVNQDDCVGCGLCTETAPEAFQLNDDGVAEVIGEADDAAIQDAIDGCPASAISEG